MWSVDVRNVHKIRAVSRGRYLALLHASTSVDRPIELRSIFQVERLRLKVHLTLLYPSQTIIRIDYYQ